MLDDPALKEPPDPPDPPDGVLGAGVAGADADVATIGGLETGFGDVVGDLYGACAATVEADALGDENAGAADGEELAAITVAVEDSFGRGIEAERAAITLDSGCTERAATTLEAGAEVTGAT